MGHEEAEYGNEKEGGMREIQQTSEHRRCGPASLVKAEEKLLERK